MCKFLSAIVLPSGDVIADPEHTDSHEHLILAHGLKDASIEDLCRVEFLPGADPAEVDGYTLQVDQEEPSWWETTRDGALARLREMVARMVLTADVECLLGGCWILNGANVGVAFNVRISAMLKTSSILNLGGASRVSCVRDSASIKGVWGLASIKGVGQDVTITNDRRLKK